MFESVDDAIDVAEKIEEAALDDHLAYLSDEALDAFAYLKTNAVREYERYRIKIKTDTPIDTRVWSSAVVDRQREQKREYIDRKKREQREVKEMASKAERIPIFEIGSNAEMAAKLRARLDEEESPLAFDRQELWKYDPQNGLWSQLKDSAVSQLLQSWDGAMIVDPHDPERSKELHVNNYAVPTQMLKHRVDTGDRGEGFFDGAPRSVTFEDVTLLVEGSAIVAADHAPSHKATMGLDFPYIPDFPTPLFDQYLEGIFYFDHDAVEKIKMLQEFVGAALFGSATDFGRAMMLHDVKGEGGTGKSQGLEIVSSIFPDSASCSIPPQALNDEYSGAELIGKRINVVYETPSDDFISEAGLKAIIHGEPITRRKIRREPVRFRPTAAHLFATNELPQAPGTTGAFWDRWMVLELNRRFRDTDEVIPNIGKKIVDRELPGVVAWAVEGAERLFRQGDYTMPDSCRKSLEKWKAEARPVQVFLDECCRQVGDVGGDSWTEASEVYERYREWAHKNGFGRLNRTNFGKRLNHTGVEKKKSSTVKYRLRLLSEWEAGSRGLDDASPI